MTTEHPAANAGAIFLVIIAARKSHGVIIPHTPMGSLKVKTFVFFLGRRNCISVRPSGFFGEPQHERGSIINLPNGLREVFTVFKGK